jgi:hypothetical protein
MTLFSILRRTRSEYPEDDDDPPLLKVIIRSSRRPSSQRNTLLPNENLHSGKNIWTPIA